MLIVLLNMFIRNIFASEIDEGLLSMMDYDSLCPELKQKYDSFVKKREKLEAPKREEEVKKPKDTEFSIKDVLEELQKEAKKFSSQTDENDFLGVNNFLTDYLERNKTKKEANFSYNEQPNPIKSCTFADEKKVKIDFNTKSELSIPFENGNGKELLKKIASLNATKNIIDAKELSKPKLVQALKNSSKLDVESYKSYGGKMSFTLNSKDNNPNGDLKFKGVVTDNLKLKSEGPECVVCDSESELSLNLDGKLELNRLFEISGTLNGTGGGVETFKCKIGDNNDSIGKAEDESREGACKGD